MQNSFETVNGAPVILPLSLSRSSAHTACMTMVGEKKSLTTTKTFRDHFHKQPYQWGNIFLPLSVWPRSLPFTLSLFQNTNTFFLLLLFFAYEENERYLIVVLLCNKKTKRFFCFRHCNIYRVYFLNNSFVEARKVFQYYHFNTF